MEFLLVKFPESRGILIGQQLIGYTNEIIEIQGGDYEISLDGAPDFMPSNQQISLINTAVLAPLTVIFSRDEQI